MDVLWISKDKKFWIFLTMWNIRAFCLFLANFHLRFIDKPTFITATWSSRLTKLFTWNVLANPSLSLQNPWCTCIERKVVENIQECHATCLLQHNKDPVCDIGLQFHSRILRCRQWSHYHSRNPHLWNKIMWLFYSESSCNWDKNYVTNETMLASNVEYSRHFPYTTWWKLVIVWVSCVTGVLIHQVISFISSRLTRFWIMLKSSNDISH